MNKTFEEIRRVLSTFTSDHDAAGSQRPTVDEIFAPDQHANALDPNTPIVVGARGAGKSFWAGVLEDDETREVASRFYPHLSLERLIVTPGYTGFDSGDAITSTVIDSRIPLGEENQLGLHFWNAVIIRSALSALNPNMDIPSVREMMSKYRDHEDFTTEMKRIDRALESSGKLLLITFDALDTLSREWRRSSRLIDALFESIWSLRSRTNIRAKLFMRPEQLSDDNLRFVELPKLRNRSIALVWTQADLYGLLFWRLYRELKDKKFSGFTEFASLAGAPLPPAPKKLRDWPLINDKKAQKAAMTLLAGPYLGKNAKRGGTYDWPYNHLADAAGNVTPRSFIQLFVGAAQYPEPSGNQAISASGIHHGLRRASKVRVDELVIEYRWIKRALIPLAGLIVPCQPEAIWQRWDESKTVSTILKAAKDPETGFTSPFPPRADGNPNSLLAEAMEKIGVFSYRNDGRIDMPDLFRVAAQMLKKGGISNKEKG
jgi:hypothetical protein